MRLAILSDVHGNLHALRQVIQHLRRQAPDMIVNLGDCVSAPLWPQETFEELQTLDAATVRGNHDRWLGDVEKRKRSVTVEFTANALEPEAKEWLVDLPPSLQLTPEVFAVHGRPGSDTTYLLEDSVDARLTLASTSTLTARLAEISAELVLCGHSHLQHSACAAGGQLVINPGSVGCPRYAGNSDADDNEAGSPHARYAIATRERGRWSVDFFAIAYDWSAVAQRARTLGRDDWARAFLRGT